MNKFVSLSIIISALAVSSASHAQNKSLNIGPAPQNIGPPPCNGFGCNQPPPPPNYGQVPPCYAPNVLVQINEWNGVRYECRFAQTQPVYPAPPPPQYGGQFSQAHYLYCIARYKSYKQATNTYTSFSGKTKFCNSPFN